MKNLVYLILAVAAIGCREKPKQTEPMQEEAPQPLSFYLGTYTNGDSKGIYEFSISDQGKLQNLGLRAEAENPTFLAKTDDGKTLLAANEIKNENGSGTVQSYSIAKDTLVLVNQSETGGAGPCFVSVNHDGFVLAANYGGGSVALFKLEGADNHISPALNVEQHTGHGTTDRQKGPHAHSAWFVPEDDEVIAVDLGTNQLWLSQLEPSKDTIVALEPHTLEMEPGAGPRHLAFHPNGKWIYVASELDSKVTLVERTGKGQYVRKASVSALPDGYTETSYCADIHVSNDGKFVYVSNRGHNSISIFKVNEEDGSISMVGTESVRGDWPRNFNITPDGDFLIVANQNSNNMVSFKVDKENGTLTYADEIQAPSPVCIVF